MHLTSPFGFFGDISPAPKPSFYCLPLWHRLFFDSSSGIPLWLCRLWLVGVLWSTMPLAAGVHHTHSSGGFKFDYSGLGSSVRLRRIHRRCRRRSLCPMEFARRLLERGGRWRRTHTALEARASWDRNQLSSVHSFARQREHLDSSFKTAYRPSSPNRC